MKTYLAIDESSHVGLMASDSVFIVETEDELQPGDKIERGNLQLTILREYDMNETRPADAAFKVIIGGMIVLIIFLLIIKYLK